MAGGLGFLQFLGGGREGCFDSKSSVVDLSVNCHEGRSLETSEGEKIFVSVKDVQKRDGEQLAPIGTTCHLKGASLDTTLLLRVWAARDDGSVQQSLDGSGGGRNCGELRIPMPRLVLHCHGMLYQSWVTLDSPGLCDSVASLGLGDDSSAFDQKLVDGPRQLLQPRVCLSICRTSDLGPNGKLLLSTDASQDARIAQWGPLLRSQQQHAVMSVALHLQGSQRGDAAEQKGNVSQQVQDLRGRIETQSEKVDELRRQLREAEERLANARDRQGEETPRVRPEREEDPMPSGLTNADPLQRTVVVEAEAEQIRAANAQQQVSLESLRAEVEQVRQQANTKIDAANDRIRSLRKDRDGALRESERLRTEAGQLVGQKSELTEEMRQLSEQKEALLRIVEDLHQSCVGAGLQASRRSIDSMNSITANFKLT